MSRRFRSAIDGKFVSAQVAHEHPETTVSEEIETLEITSEMVEAGVELLSDWAKRKDGLEDVVVEIYVAMRSLEK